jgi:predicted oxidoreductase
MVRKCAGAASDLFANEGLRRLAAAGWVQRGGRTQNAYGNFEPMWQSPDGKRLLPESKAPEALGKQGGDGDG